MMLLRNFSLYIGLVLTVVRTSQAVSRRAMINSALRLECRYNQTIVINRVVLEKDQPHCSYTLSSDHTDYVRVVDECSGRQSCSNIVLKDSTQIPCASVGNVDSEYMTVHYSCISQQSMLSVCHNTIRTVSPFEGYLATPGYPSTGVQAIPEGSVCNCQIRSLSDGISLELLLLDMTSSKQVKVTEPSGVTQYMCANSMAKRCINGLTTSYYSNVNITFLPDPQKPAKFLLQFRAVGRSSRVRAVCSMTMISSPPVVLNDTSVPPATNATDKQQVEELIEEVLSLEVILGICVAVVLFLLLVIVTIIVYRQYQDKRRSKETKRGIFRVLTADGNPTYDLVAEECHEYSNASDLRKSSRSASDHIYQEPTDVIAEERRLCPGYDEPCASGGANYYSAAAIGSGVYESVEYSDEGSSRQHSRLGQMQKTGSMPLHPAPPIPRNAELLEKKVKGRRCHLPPSGNQSSVLKSKSALEPTAPKEPNEALPRPSASKPELRASPTPSDAPSMDFLPKLNIDFSDILIEADRRFVSQAANDGEYMQPVQSLIAPSDPMELVENSLYVKDN